MGGVRVWIRGWRWEGPHTTRTTLLTRRHRVPTRQLSLVATGKTTASSIPSLTSKPHGQRTKETEPTIRSLKWMHHRQGTKRKQGASFHRPSD
jgi:hypothetical protein